MDPAITDWAQANGGWIFRAQLLQLGYNDRLIRALVQQGDLKRIRQGTYSPTIEFSQLDALGRHRVLAGAVISRLGSDFALSHVSAAVMHGLDIWNIDLSDVHVTRLTPGSGRREAGVCFHNGATDIGDDVVQIDGVNVLNPAQAAVTASLIVPLEPSVVLFSSLLREHGCEKVDLEADFDAKAQWQGARRARLAMRVADGGSESIGESRSMFMFWRGAIPRPQTQYQIIDDSGRVIARTDYFWKEFHHVGEFDGKVKYQGGAENSPEDAVYREKVREDRIRAQGLGMTRWSWADLAQPKVTLERVRHGLEQSRRLYGGNTRYFPG